MSLPVVIVGAGPVGLTLALLLKQHNIPVVIYEAVNEIKPLGVGINLLPHSVRVLYDLGLADQLDEVGVKTSALHYYNKFGQQIWAEPRGQFAGYQYPQYSVHRGQLQLLLFREVLARLPENSVLTGHRLVSWNDTDNGVDVQFATADGDITVSAGCLIAADGINSTARKRLYPNEGDPIYGGRILWRGTTMAEPFLNGSTMFMAGHQDQKFVAYPISHAAAQSGRALINWIAELSVPEWNKELQDWNKEVSIDTFLEPFLTWDFGWVNVAEIIRGCSQVYEFPLSDRDPLPRWTFNRMTLIGDAAHPMYPIGSNGASQGILDAEKLVQSMLDTADIESAFACYENERRPATANIVLLNRQNGPEQVMQIAQQRAPCGFDDIEQVIPREELEGIAAKYKQTAGFSVDAVNQKS